MKDFVLKYYIFDVFRCDYILNFLFNFYLITEKNILTSLVGFTYIYFTIYLLFLREKETKIIFYHFGKQVKHLTLKIRTRPRQNSVMETAILIVIVKMNDFTPSGIDKNTFESDDSVNSLIVRCLLKPFR